MGCVHADSENGLGSMLLDKPPAMLIEVLLVVALPFLGTFFIALLRKVVDGEPLDFQFGNDAGLEMIVLV
jgi:hypothetical protein